MSIFWTKLRNLFRKKQKAQDPDWKVLESMLGFSIRNKNYYRLALIDPSCNKTGENTNKIPFDNDRLEFLGDSIIGASVSKYLYLKHPESPVGPMSEMKARIVSREVGDTIALRIGIKKLLRRDRNNPLAKDALGNALEAIVGAIFLDKGFEQAERFVLDKMIPIYEDIKEENPDLGTNYKNKLLEWGLKEKVRVEFKLLKHHPGKHCYFISEVFVNDKSWGNGKSHTKKASEQVASKHALRALRKKGIIKE